MTDEFETTEVNSQVFCTSCNVAIEGRLDADGQQIGVCPTCGVSDKLENVMREAAEAIAYFMAKQLQATITDTGRDGDALTFTAEDIPERHFRFIFQSE